ncbi:hypothetical protein PHJA_000407800 [Phtheirospermum japonicum]|uniref:Uncharacterized protein n=1 Tax=Phtheirospermum japonicum TaxID=374723 RepID=A0A830B6F6_9LAMI|nr:hypothetical protein PHJA_000407800 [Phtheirospermum japonicum]
MLEFCFGFVSTMLLMKNVLRFAINRRWEESIDQGTRNSSAGGSSEPIKALDLLQPLGPFRRSYSIWIYKPPLPGFGVLVAILIVISLAVRRAVGADFPFARLCFALWIADIGNFPQIEYMNI